LVAAGSLVLAVSEPPSVSLLVVLPGAYLLVHGLTAWKLHQYWRYRLVEAQRAAAAEGATELQRRMRTCAERCASWRWCFKHPFNQEYWPQSAMPREPPA
jgi:hypothetical protein